MKKLIALVAIFAFVMAISVSAIAATPKATLINSSGDKVVVAVGSTQAQKYFSAGYVLLGAPLAQNQCVCQNPVGAFAGTDIYEPIRFNAGFGGNVVATSTVSTAMTLTSAFLDKNTVIQVTPLTAALTYTLPATSTLSSIMRNVGDSRQWIFKNATSTAAATFTLAKGAGWDLVGVDANVDVIAGAAVGSEVYMALNCYRQPSKDITCIVSENIAAD